MEKKSLILRTLGLALILAVVFAGCYLIRGDEEEEEEEDLPLVPNAFIDLDSSEKYQYVRGFGGMDVPWSEFFAISEAEYERMYNPNTGLGFNMMRIMIMPVNGQYTENPKTYTDTNNNNKMDEDEKFDFTDDPGEMIDWYIGEGGGPGKGLRPNYVEGVKIVNKHGGYVLASPWSPPRNWKANGKIIGGSGNSGRLLPEHYQVYADYLKDFAEEMSSRGAPIYAISIQNEPNYSTSKADYAGCDWTNAQMRDFFKAVGNFTEGVAGKGGGEDIPRVLIMNGESANTPTINNEAMTDTASRAVIDLLARHNYGDIAVPYAYSPDPAVGPRYGKEMWMTEWNKNSESASLYPNDSKWDYVWVFLNDVDLTIRIRQDNAYVWWALKRFYSFIGDGQYGTTEGAILPRGYALSHYAKFAKEKDRIGVSFKDESVLASGVPIGTNNVNNVSINQTNLSIRVTAFMSKDGKEISVVMYAPTDGSGSGGYDLGAVQINLPSGFVIDKATAMRSKAEAMGKTENVRISGDKTYAIVPLARSEILSVMFTRK